MPNALTLLRNIVLNARRMPDPEMKGTADIYSVPLDDIEAARKFLDQRRSRFGWAEGDVEIHLPANRIGKKEPK